MSNVTNWEKLIPKNLTPKYHNPHFKKHNMSLPFRLLIAAPSGSGKTSNFLDLINIFDNTFQDIFLCVKNSDEPLYNYLKQTLSSNQLHVYDNSFPDISELDNAGLGQSLICFDDFVLDKNQSHMIEYFIRARKIGNGMSCVYISQSYYDVPKAIRINCNYIILKKLSGNRDLKAILKQYVLGVNISTLEQKYMNALKGDKGNFFMIDIETDKPHLKFRKNFG